ncbi:MAG: hypothetical protein FJW34_21250, partial [Acidobacteria bacterium]|nr:hypothetical protein [Acidobacteriota bacterium]
MIATAEFELCFQRQGVRTDATAEPCLLPIEIESSGTTTEKGKSKTGTKQTVIGLLSLILLSTPLTAKADQYGDFTYSSNGSAITITGYTGAGGSVTVPSTINGLPVTGIGNWAFWSIITLT